MFWSPHRFHCLWTDLRRHGCCRSLVAEPTRLSSQTVKEVRANGGGGTSFLPLGLKWLIWLSQVCLVKLLAFPEQISRMLKRAVLGRPC